MLSRIQDWDNRMLDRISKLRTKRLNKIMVGATTIGNSGLVWFVLAIALLPFQKLWNSHNNSNYCFLALWRGYDKKYCWQSSSLS